MKLQYYVDVTILFIAERKRTMNFDGSSIRDLSTKMQKLIMFLNMDIYRYKRYFHVLGGMLPKDIKVVLWTLLFAIPGIIKQYAYYLTPYILVDMPEISVSEASKLSCKITKGYK